MLSRIADSLFWLNRYMERANGLLRLTATHYNLSLDQDVYGFMTWAPVLECFAFITPEEITFIEQDTGTSLRKLLIDSSNGNSLKLMINKARENARGAQDHLTKELWEEINQMYHFVNNHSVAEELNGDNAVQIIQSLSHHTVMFTGLAEITMPRGKGWYFMNLGRYVERCLQTIVITESQLRLKHFGETEVNDMFQWRYLLLALSGYELHLKTYHTPNYNYNVLHQVLLNENFTRSVLYSLTRIDIYLKRSIQPELNEDLSGFLGMFGRLYSKVKFADLNTLDSISVQLFLNEIKVELLTFSKKLEHQFFSYS